MREIARVEKITKYRKTCEENWKASIPKWDKSLEERMIDLFHT